ncbi:unnamed protein product [Rotaria sordida]|uniref:(S)-2-hydroxy-acid oxidase n=1 Tax=Rotaria sordida TaxID=392033 RepID=A0A815Z524_9BILA|nr:unnamed protein product [Rotaria sordida]CAF1580310.1 unnamed protein product [Rotaria sordida]
MPTILSKVDKLYLLTIGAVGLCLIIKYYRRKRFEQKKRTSGYLECHSLDDFENLAKEILLPHRFNYFNYQVGYGCTYQTSREYFNRHLKIIPKVLTDVSEMSLQTTIFGHIYSNPIIIAPTAFHRLAHYDGEWGTAQGATNAESIYIYNWSLSTVSVNDVLKTKGPKWLHVYLSSSKALLEQCILLAEQQSFKAIVVTCDHPHERVQSIHKAAFIRATERKQDKTLKEILYTPNTNIARLKADERLDDHTPNEKLTWKEFQWLRTLTKLPIICKGILSVDDAKLALEYGADGIVVSNHGGRQVDSGLSAIECLKDIVEFVNGRCEVFVDSGIRTGTDVLKCLALGAKGVLIGRPILYGLACGGHNGVEAVLNLLKQELMYDMASCGLKRIEQINERILYKYRQ